MLATFHNLDYNLEWRVINAADYGHAQRRRRVFIFAYKKDISFDKEQSKLSMENILFKEGFFAKPFPVKEEAYLGRISKVEDLPTDRVFITDNYSFDYHTAGVMRDGKFISAQTEPVTFKPTPLRDILLKQTEVDETYYLTAEEEKKFEYLRGAKKVERTSTTGHKYYFSEGGMSPTDSLYLPGRTMLTSEGSRNRSTHIVEVDGRKRYLTPVECERLNEFDDNWTEGMNDRMRYFTMGNALVVGLIEKIGKRIEEIDVSSSKDVVQLELL
jgi:DNA (cytosine-5)-methyltransferase 1